MFKVNSENILFQLDFQAFKVYGYFFYHDLPSYLRSHSQDLIPGPGILSQEPGEAGEKTGKKRASQRLDCGGGVNFFPQLDEANNEGRKELERGA